MNDPLTPSPRAMFNCWWPVYDHSSLAAWVREGRAVSVGDDHGILGAALDHSDCYIRVHRVTTFAEYTLLIQSYRSLSKSFSIPEYELTCLLRGQSQDHYDGNGHVVSTPSAFRSNELAHGYLSLQPDTALAAEWRQWAQVINQVTAVMDVSGPLYRLSDPNQPERKVASEGFDKTLSGRLTTNLYLMALAMHYGFPTASLDVTPDHEVALWFALHATLRDENGLIRYVPNPGQQGDPAGPSVYVYIQPTTTAEYPAVDLTSLDALKGKAHRPFVQSAWGLPFYGHGASWMGDMDARLFRIAGPCARWPSAIIKPEFGRDELKRVRAMHCAEELFPPGDPLYQALIAANVPRIARYYMN